MSEPLSPAIRAGDAKAGLAAKVASIIKNRSVDRLSDVLNMGDVPTLADAWRAAIPDLAGASPPAVAQILTKPLVQLLTNPPEGVSEAEAKLAFRRMIRASDQSDQSGIMEWIWSLVGEMPRSG